VNHLNGDLANWQDGKGMFLDSPTFQAIIPVGIFLVNINIL
jgi:hypothetical protein